MRRGWFRNDRYRNRDKAERLEAKRAALLNRREDLRDVLEAAPADIAITREKWHLSEAAADERRLKAAQTQSETASELTELEADRFTIDTFLAEELAKAQAAARERLAARLA
jgi:RecA-family ATPase